MAREGPEDPVCRPRKEACIAGRQGFKFPRSMNGWRPPGIKPYTFCWWYQLIRKTYQCGFYLTALANIYIFQFWGSFIRRREKNIGWNFLVGDNGQVWGPLLFQILKAADNSKLLPPVLVSIRILILIVLSLPLPFPALASIRHLKLSYYCFFFKLGSHKGYWSSHSSSLRNRILLLIVLKLCLQ